MKSVLLSAFLLIGSYACYQVPEIPGFDSTNWNRPITRCSDSKIEQAQLIVDHEELILGSGQAIVKKLLGHASENELYTRNQKFFYYDLTPGDSCSNIKTQKRLSIKFDALDRAKEVVIIER